MLAVVPAENIDAMLTLSAGPITDDVRIIPNPGEKISADVFKLVPALGQPFLFVVGIGHDESGKY